MIIEDYVSFETAKLLKEKGFDESCYQKYDDEGYLSFNHTGYINEEKPTEDFSALAPTLQMAMKWLREEHNIDILITIGGFIEKGKVYFCSVYKNLTKYGNFKECLTYEDACEVAIKYCLENLI